MTTENTPSPENTPAPETETPAVEETTDPVAKTTEPVAKTTEPVAETTKPVAEKKTAEKKTAEKKTAEKKIESKPIPKPSGDAPDGHWWWGTGRRKAAVARVRIRPGNGEFQVNKRPLTEFFSEMRDHQNILTVLDKTNTKGSVDVFVNTNGGGYTGQAGAIILGLGRALSKYDPSLESILRDNGYLSRDPRKVERKKPGQPGARKRFQFSKR